MVSVLGIQRFDAAELIFYTFLERFPQNLKRFPAFKDIPLSNLKVSISGICANLFAVNRLVLLFRVKLHSALTLRSFSTFSITLLMRLIRTRTWWK